MKSCIRKEENKIEQKTSNKTFSSILNDVDKHYTYSNIKLFL